MCREYLIIIYLKFSFCVLVEEKKPVQQNRKRPSTGSGGGGGYRGGGNQMPKPLLSSPIARGTRKVLNFY